MQEEADHIYSGFKKTEKKLLNLNTELSVGDKFLDVMYVEFKSNKKKVISKKGI